MWLPIQLLLVAFLSSDTIGEVLKDYNGYKIYRVELKTGDKSYILRKFNGIQGFDLSVLRRHNYSHVMISPQLQKQFRRTLQNNNINYDIINNNVGRLILKEYEQRINIDRRSFQYAEYDFSYFPRYYEIVDFMKFLVEDRKYCQMIKIGRSSQNLTIYAMKIEKSPEKPVFILDAGFHAREWASHVTALYIMKKIVQHEEKFADLMTFIIIPCINPDGYEFSHSNDRFWRKTRSDQKSSNCKGVDLNRNFDVHWRDLSDENERCGETYAGPKPFSEPESRALRDTILKYDPFVYITLHSFGSLIMYPWGYKKDLPRNWKILHKIATKAAQSANYGTNYIVGSSARVLYEASGGSDDWAMKKASVPIVYTIELPEFDGNLFIMPQEKIKGLVSETYKIFISMVNNIYKEYKQ